MSVAESVNDLDIVCNFSSSISQRLHLVHLDLHYKATTNFL